MEKNEIYFYWETRSSLASSIATNSVAQSLEVLNFLEGIINDQAS